MPLPPHLQKYSSLLDLVAEAIVRDIEAGHIPISWATDLGGPYMTHAQVINLRLHILTRTHFAMGIARGEYE
jgi:hypothetical protein